MHLRVLVIEPDPEDLLFLEDVLAEIEQTWEWRPPGDRWIHVETLAASTWMEAAVLLGRESVDVVLLDPNLSDSLGVATFRRLQVLAPRIPVIALTGAGDRDLAAQLVHEGAQDYLIKKHVDCAPLAHAIHNAIERQRRLVAARATNMTDPLTGLLNRDAFLTFAERDRALAGRLRRRWLLLLLELRDLPQSNLVSDEQRRDLALIETCDGLLGLAGSTTLLARVSNLSFAMALFDTPDESVESARERIKKAAGGRLALGSAIFEPDRPESLEMLMQLAEAELAPAALAMRR